MSKIIHRLANDPRVRHISKGAAPRNVTRTKIMTLTVKRGADFTHRIAEYENLVNELLAKKLYARMKPTNIYRGEFEVIEGFEDAFKEIAGSHGFNATEVIECP